MKTKKAVAFWCNLKGNYDIVIFNNKNKLNKFVKEYNILYEDFENEKYDFEEFCFFTETLAEHFEEYILHVENEIFSKEIKDNIIILQINNEKIKVEICNFLDYGY